ncbi:MAG: NAD(P)/FAD-dependent oxidoreductase [Pseudomonadota bacterium]|nr:NAD(P)/FAD-dependent oxidoreductase [Pseudomonadota bacterium]
MDETLDCLIIGGGPAGLTAAIYLSRFHLDIMVVDGGKSRAAWIPTSHNHAGYPEGINGAELLRRMREQAQLYGTKVETGQVTRLEKDGNGGWSAEWGSGPVTARTVLLATGVTNRRPPMDMALHDDAMARGLIRYCPICDGYEVTDKKVAVIGSGERGLTEARFLRSYTADLTLVSPDLPHDLEPAMRAELAEMGVTLIDGPLTAIEPGGETIALVTETGRHDFDSIYPALGSDTHIQLAEMVGASLAGDACVKIDSHQRTGVPGVYAAGDVVLGLDQISHAMGEGGVAATTIRNDLAKDRPIRRKATSA